jgi:hypothetical protein
MAIIRDAKRAKTGQLLVDYEAQAINAINQLTTIKIELSSIKSTVNSDADFDVDDSAEVQETLDRLAGLLSSI